MAAYYNENDPYCVEWLRNLIKRGLIADGDVDGRDIRLVQPEDLKGYAQCHFFAGIGGWSLALRLAGWEDGAEVWTGSCPCQPFSSAARGRGKRADCERHLWPIWRKLIAAARPCVVFGEQVAQAADWHADAGDDMEADGYAFGSAYLPSLSVGRDHPRSRFYYTGYANGQGKPVRALNEKVARLQRHRCVAASLVPSDGIPARVASMRGFGNAIDPQVAAEFVSASREAIAGGG